MNEYDYHMREAEKHFKKAEFWFRLGDACAIISILTAIILVVKWTVFP